MREVDYLDDPAKAAEYLNRSCGGCSVAQAALKAYEDKGSSEATKELGLTAARCSLMGGGILMLEEEGTVILCVATGEVVPYTDTEL